MNISSLSLGFTVAESGDGPRSPYTGFLTAVPDLTLLRRRPRGGRRAAEAAPLLLHLIHAVAGSRRCRVRGVAEGVVIRPAADAYAGAADPDAKSRKHTTVRSGRLLQPGASIGVATGRAGQPRCAQKKMRPTVEASRPRISGRGREAGVRDAARYAAAASSPRSRSARSDSSRCAASLTVVSSGSSNTNVRGEGSRGGARAWVAGTPRPRRVVGCDPPGSASASLRAVRSVPSVLVRVTPSGSSANAEAQLAVSCAIPRRGSGSPSARSSSASRIGSAWRGSQRSVSPIGCWRSWSVQPAP
jgi:hypothetical protein